MSTQMFKFIIKYIHCLPTYISKKILFSTNKFIKSEILFDTIQYKSDYNSDNLTLIFLPLLMNISQISQDIHLLTNNKKLVSIISIIIFQEKDTKNEYTHSLSESNKLYSADNISQWPSDILFNILSKLETYNSFTKISIIIKVKAINPV